MTRRRSVTSILLLALLVPILAACGTGGGGASPSGSAGGASPSGSAGTGASASPSASGAEDSASASPDASPSGAAGSAAPAGGEVSGSVEVLGAFTNPQEVAGFEAVIAAFEEANPGVDVTYVGSSDFDTQIEVRVQAGDAPDIAGFPQPGGMARLARNNQLAQLPESVTSLVEQNYAAAWQDLGSVDGTPYGVFHRVNAKGFVWYNEPDWTAGGYQAPETWDDLLALTEQLKGTDRAPWTEGIGAQAATGWKGTDWIESIILRQQPVEFYDRWAAGQVDFTSPEVRAAFDELGKIWLGENTVYGGTPTIALTDVPLAATYIYGEPPQGWLHFQGSFVTNFFPEDVQANIDEQAGFFVLPSFNDQPPPALVGGDVFTVTAGNDRPEVIRFMEFLASVESTAPWASTGGALFPHRGQDFSVYPTETERQLAESVVEAEQVRFDGSDQMPSELNQAFWQGITNWVSGNRDLDGALQDIEAARPK